MALVPGLLILNPSFTKLLGPAEKIRNLNVLQSTVNVIKCLLKIICSREIHGSPSINISIHFSSPYAINQTIKDEGDHLQTDELLAAASHRSAEETMRKSKPSDLNGGRDAHQTGNPMTQDISRYP